MPEVSGKVYRLSDFRRAANTDSATTESPSVVTGGQVFSRFSDGNAGAPQGYTDVESLYDEAAESKISSFLRLLSESVGHLRSCSSALEAGDRLIADTEFMAARRLLSELFMFRDVNDSIGLVVLRSIEACEGVIAITEYPTLPQEIASVLSTLYHRTFMSFENAMELVGSLKARDGRDLPRIGGLTELIDLLTQDPIQE